VQNANICNLCLIMTETKHVVKHNTHNTLMTNYNNYTQ